MKESGVKVGIVRPGGIATPGYDHAAGSSQSRRDCPFSCCCQNYSLLLSKPLLLLLWPPPSPRSMLQGGCSRPGLLGSSWHFWMSSSGSSCFSGVFWCRCLKRIHKNELPAMTINCIVFTCELIDITIPYLGGEHGAGSRWWSRFDGNQPHQRLVWFSSLRCNEILLLSNW